MASEKQSAERKDNIRDILAYLRANGEKSRREVANELGLSWGCVSEIVSVLMTEGVLTEEKTEGAGTKGRRPAVLALNGELCFLGVDVNMNGLKACVCNLLGEKVCEMSGELDCTSREAFSESVTEFVKEVLGARYEILSICFAMQGICDKESGVWDFPAPNVGKIDFEKEFWSVFGVPISVEHDPDCILYGCLERNEGSKMAVRIDRGIGASFYKNGAFRNDEPLEIGYMTMNGEGERLHKIVSLSAAERAAEAGQTASYLERAGRYLGIALGNICNLLKPDTVYLCGDLVSEYDLMNGAFYDAYAKTAIYSETEIAAVKVTDAAYGAAKRAVDGFCGKKGNWELRIEN